MTVDFLIGFILGLFTMTYLANKIYTKGKIL